jgi:hypothetical protein
MLGDARSRVMSFWHLERAYDVIPDGRFNARWISGGYTCAGTCPLDPGHGKDFRLVRPLAVKLASSRPADFLWGELSELLGNQRVRAAFGEAKLTGVEFRPAAVRAGRQKVPDTDTYAELWVTGWGGIAARESGVRLTAYCPGCNRQSYEIPHPERLIDAAAWDGSDIFAVWPLPAFIFCSDRARGVIESGRFTGIRTIPASEFRFLGDGDCSPLDADMPEARMTRVRERFGL